MPEPDFDQITVDLATRAGGGDILPHIKEALRQVWNARGAADLAVIESELSPQYQFVADDAIRSLDR